MHPSNAFGPNSRSFGSGANLTSLSAVQFENAIASIISTLAGISISSKLSHPSKHSLLSQYIDSGSLTSLSAVHFENACSSIIVTLSGIYILSRELQPWKADMPILDIPAGRSTSLSESHHENANSFISVTLSDITAFFRFLHSLNALSSRLFALSPITTSTRSSFCFPYFPAKPSVICFSDASVTVPSRHVNTVFSPVFSLICQTSSFL